MHQYISGVFDNCHLHPQADSKKGNIIFPHIAYGINFTLDPPATKTRGYDKTVKLLELFFSVDLILLDLILISGL